MNRLAHRTAIVTGAGAGLGKAYATLFCEEGATVAIFDYNGKAGEATAKELQDAGYDARFYQCNVADESNVREDVDAFLKEEGHIDILVNNAQATDHSATPSILEETTEAAMKLNWSTGALGTFFCAKAVVPQMKKQHYGRIINTGSSSGLQGLPTFTAYGSQKEAIRGMTKVWARELGTFGITCNVIMPAALTDAAKLWKSMDPEGYKKAIEPMPIQRLGDPKEDIAPLVLFLASEESQYITGQTIGADGGTTMY